MPARVQNVGRLKRKLKRMPPAVRDAIGDGLRENALEMARLADRLKPYSGIDVGVERTRGREDSGIGVKASSGLSFTVFAVGDDDHPDNLARWVEFGTQSSVKGQEVVSAGRSRTSRRTHPGTPAQPFFFPTYRLLRRRFKSRMSRKRNRAIKRVIQGV